MYQENDSFITRSCHWRCSVKKDVFKISRNPQENTCVGVSFFTKVAGLWPATLTKKRLQHRCFPVNFTEHL